VLKNMHQLGAHVAGIFPVTELQSMPST